MTICFCDAQRFAAICRKEIFKARAEMAEISKKIVSGMQKIAPAKAALDAAKLQLRMTERQQAKIVAQVARLEAAKTRTLEQFASEADVQAAATAARKSQKS